MVPIALALMAISSINVALPTIEQGLGASPADLQWALSGYALAFGIVLIPAGRIGDTVGRSMLFTVGLAVFTLASLACGLASTPAALNLARLAQGIGAALYNPQVMGMIQQLFSGRGRARAFALLGMVIAVSVAVGPLVAGTMIAWLGPHDGWRASFLLNTPLGLVGVVLALRWLPFGRERQRRRLAREARAVRARGGALDRRRERLDLDPVGALLLAVAVLCVMFPFTAHGSTWLWSLVPLGLVLLGGWLGWERAYRARGHAPMVDPALFAFPSFSFGTAVSGIFFVGSTSIFVIAALFLQQGLGASALATGLVTLPNAILSAGSAHWSGRHTVDHGRSIVVGAIVLIAGSCVAAVGVARAVVDLGASFWWLALPWALAGIGQGALGAANQTMTLEDVPSEVGGTAGGVMSTAQRIGTAIGNAMITSIFFGAAAGSGFLVAFRTAYLTIAAVLLVAAVIAVGDLRVARRRTVSSDAARSPSSERSDGPVPTVQEYGGLGRTR
ncbi:MFS transporter [Raineyella fluvialis]|uniref:MFS transporter n=2 Tax=Raineyella fluvialis TaxID=2662261 RepID=A0A5Q2FHD5_9ACTN|nr:MFS transporter [Raineyella fluvialis]